jgi:type I restriction enzyme S subunit
MKAGWEIKKLGEVCEFEGGSQPPKSNFIYEPKEGYIRFLQIRDFGTDKHSTFIPNSKKNRLCSSDDILIGRYGASVGKILTGKSGAYNVALMKTEPDLQIMERGWFYNYLISNSFQHSLMTVADRSAQNGFSKEDIFNFPIPIPPLDEQHRIVAILDEAFAAIATAKANTEKNLQNAKDLLSSYLSEVFSKKGDGWVEKKLGEVFSTVTGNTPPKNTPEFYGSFIPLVKPPELLDAPLDSASDGLSEAGAKVARTVPPRSLLVSCIGNLGKIGINTVPVAFNQQINAILPNETKALPEFLFLQLLSTRFREQLESLASGTTVPIVNKSKFNSIEIVIPPLDEQHRIVGYLNNLKEETSRLTSFYTQKLAALEDLKKSLLHQAFTGKL